LSSRADAAAFASAIRSILSEYALAERLRAAALKRARAYDWRVLSVRAVGVYERVLRENM
jgi:glycosyltransferase involved in cell wall biosynthesis